MIFNGFEQILMAVIQATSHSEKYKTNEQRFDEAMKAIFGKHYSATYAKNPADVSISEIRKILALQKSGESLQGSIHKVVRTRYAKPKDEAEKREIEGKLNLVVDRIKKHIQRNKPHYESLIAADSDDDIIHSPYLNEQQSAAFLEERQAIFVALRKAGWPV